MYKVDPKIPAMVMDGMIRYVRDREEVGGFLTAVIENNLKESFGRADEDSREVMFDIVKWFYNETPGACWGSKEKRIAWLKGRGERDERNG